MSLNDLKINLGAKATKKRVGRGVGSGMGKTSTRGNKGHKARSGGTTKRGYEGGQTPIHRRLPKFGFKNHFSVTYSIVNIQTLESLKDIDSSQTINKEYLYNRGLISNLKKPVKLLANGDLTKKLNIEVNKASTSAIEKVQKAGGQVIVKA